MRYMPLQVRIPILSVLLWLVVNSMAIAGAEDSLRNLVKILDADSARVQALNALSFQLWDTEPDSAI